MIFKTSIWILTYGKQRPEFKPSGALSRSPISHELYFAVLRLKLKKKKKSVEYLWLQTEGTSFLVVPLPRFLKSEQKPLIRDVDTWPPGFCQALERENGWRQEQIKGKMTDKNLKKGKRQQFGEDSEYSKVHTTIIQENCWLLLRGTRLSIKRVKTTGRRTSLSLEKHIWKNNMEKKTESKWNKLYWRHQPSSFKCSIITGLSIVKEFRRFTLVSKGGREEKKQ